jgi:TPP-dependent pyruvate/acetoin dehydrogenase alpha subunit
MSQVAAPSVEVLLKIYRIMVQTRLFDAKIVALHRQGRISIYATSEGEEALSVASTLALANGDWLFPDYRSTGALFARGVSMPAYLSQLLGSGRDLSKGRQMPTHHASKELRIASVSTPVGNGIVHATGLAWAAKLRNGGEAALVFFGDGATSSDGFHAGLNIAGVHRLPVVFLCRNNQYAISLPLAMQTASKNLAVKAEAYGFAGIQIDGNDAIAMYETTARALARARAGEGPTLIEAVAYRVGSHTTSDDARRYRHDQQVDEWRRRDGIERLNRHLCAQQVWDAARDARFRQELALAVDSAVDAALSEPPPAVDTLFDDVYAAVPRHLAEQRRELLKGRGR